MRRSGGGGGPHRNDPPPPPPRPRARRTDRNVKQHGDEHQDQVGRPDIDEAEPMVAAALDQHVDGWGLERPTMRLRVGGGLDKHARAADALEQALVFVHCLLPMEQGVSCG